MVRRRVLLVALLALVVLGVAHQAAAAAVRFDDEDGKGRGEKEG
jgi:hypothetical protein